MLFSIILAHPQSLQGIKHVVREVYRLLKKSAAAGEPEEKSLLRFGIDAVRKSLATPRPERAWYRHLSFQILLAMILGVIVGHAWPQYADAWKPLGGLFTNIVRMLVAPIIFCTAVHGIVRVGEEKRWAASPSNR
jgi:hypothetical protein